MPPRKKPRKGTQADTDAEGDDERLQSVSTAATLTDIDLTILNELLPDVSPENPTTDAISACFRLILTQHDQLSASLRQSEELNALIERKDVELDQAFQDREGSVRALEVSLEEAHEELKKVRREKEEAEKARTSAEAQLSQVSSTHLSSSQELESLRRRVDEVEREKRDLLGVISRLKDDATQYTEELQSLREDIKTVRKERHEMESTTRELRSTETSTKFKIETLTQQLQLAKDESERINVDLHSKMDEFAKYRRDKHAEIIQLQSSLDSVTQSLNQTQSTLRSLQSSHNAQTHQLSQALQKVQDLTGQLADQESKYSSEASNLRRLIDMMEEREAEAKKIVANIEGDWESMAKKTAAKEKELREELEEEHRKVDVLEKQLDDMQLVMDKMGKGELPPLPTFGGSSRRMSEIVSQDDLTSFSPGLAMVSRMQKSGKTFTEVYAEYVRLQEELAKKNVEYDRMDRTLSEVLAQIEERAPMLAELRKDHERVQHESLQLAQQLAQTLADRDSYKLQFEDLQQKFSKTEKENKALELQADDLGHQIQGLLRQIARHDDPTLPDDTVSALVPENTQNSIDTIITSNLVLFRSIPELQDQNRKMLAITRELGRRMETEEKDYAERLEREQVEAIREAHEAIQTLQSQLEAQQRSHHAQLEAYVKERDTLKTMLGRQDRGGEVSHSNGRVNAAAPSVQKELEEVQTDFESYRKEIGVDNTKLREELNHYQSEASHLAAALAKANAKIDFLGERQRMAQEQYAMQARDFDELTKRNQQLYDQYTRLDIACSHANEELLTATGQLERLRSECTNLRAEKKIWEAVQMRLVDENKLLTTERSRLSDVMANVQRMHNDLERYNDGDRRRIETQLQAAEAQIHDLQNQLSRERDTVRQTNLQKDIETNELRSKLDRTATDLAKTRELLVAAETGQKHLEERVNDLLKQVKSGEEKLAVYGRSTSGAVSGAASGNDVHRDTQLEAEVAELRASLKSAEMDLATARSHVQQFQEISQASEAALASLSATHDEYKVSTEAEIAKRESDYQALLKKLEIAQEEISRCTAQNNELQQVLDNERASFLADKKTLEDAIIDITNSQSASRNDQVLRQEAIREQEAQLKAAEDKYTREVIAHAESIKTVDALKSDLNITRTSLTEAQTKAETAQAKLTNSEESWKRQKESLDKEMDELRGRYKDLESQNAVLHQYLETVSSQATKIRQAADSSLAHLADADAGADKQDEKLAELNALVAYMRKEKSILELQLDVAKQENARQQSQIEHLNRALLETRNVLTEEREKAAESLESTAKHSELLERINQSNILRESNATLRAESEANARRARQVEAQVASLTSELEPLKEELRAAKAEAEGIKLQMIRLEEENKHWKDRNSQLLTKYDRIDPNDVQALRDEIDDLQIDARKFGEEKADLEKKVEALQNQNNTLQEYKSKYLDLTQDTKARFNVFSSQIAKQKEAISKLIKERDDAVAERDRLKVEASTASSSNTGNTGLDVDNLKNQLQTLSNEKADLEQKLSQATSRTSNDQQTELEAIRQERDALLLEKEKWKANSSSDAPNSELLSALEQAKSSAKMAEERVATLTEELSGIRFQNEKFQTRMKEHEKRRMAEGARQEALTLKFKKEQEEAVAAATEKLRSELQVNSSTQELTARHAAEMRLLETKLVEKFDSQLAAAVEAARKEALSTVGSNSQDKAEADKALLEKHQQALKAAVERGRNEYAAKLKLKDTMLTKAQTNVKQLEAQIKSWKAAGLIPPEAETSATSIPAPVPAPAKATPIPSTSTSSATPSVQSTSAPVTTPATPGPSSLPRKPSLSVTATPKSPVVINQPTQDAAANSVEAASSSPSVRGAPRGRGASRGATARGRGAPPPLGRGGGPVNAAANAAVNSTTTGAPSGMSIIGAAAKRPREDAGTADSLAKRIRPVEAQTATGTRPVALRRPPPANPPPTA